MRSLRVTESPADHATLILAPLGGDAEAIAEAVGGNGPTRICADGDSLAAAITAETNVSPLSAIISEEGASEAVADRLMEALETEPSWSHLPILFLVASATRPPPAVERLASLTEPPSFIMQERPVHPTVLARINATQIAHRRRQFRTAELMRQLEEAESRQRFLLAELNHRTRNMLAVLQGIFKMTARQSEDVGTLTERFADRMDSIVTAHTALTQEGRQQRELSQLVTEHVRPYCRTAGQLQLGGPEVMVSAKRSFELSMIFHELATNSAKYGALSVAEGTVEIAWEEPVKGSIDVRWEERGGPTVAPPEHEGLGTQLIRGGSFGGPIDAELRYDPSGLVWTARLELA